MVKKLALSMLISLSVVLATAPGANSWSATTESEYWAWPVEQQRQVVHAFEEPAHEYAAGHRGIKIGGNIGSTVTAPTDAVVLFRGNVAGRGVMTLETPGGLVITLEPILSTLSAGAVVPRGTILGEVGIGGPSPPGQVHIGVRLDGHYLDPLPFFGKIPRAVLYPCC